MELRKLIDVLYISLFLTLAKQPKTCERRLSLSMYIYIYRVPGWKNLSSEPKTHFQVAERSGLLADVRTSLKGFMAAAKFDGPMEYPVEGYVPVGLDAGVD